MISLLFLHIFLNFILLLQKWYKSIIDSFRQKFVSELSLVHSLTVYWWNLICQGWNETFASRRPYLTQFPRPSTARQQKSHTSDRIVTRFPRHLGYSFPNHCHSNSVESLQLDNNKMFSVYLDLSRHANHLYWKDTLLSDIITDPSGKLGHNYFPCQNYTRHLMFCLSTTNWAFVTTDFKITVVKENKQYCLFCKPTQMFFRAFP